MQAPLRRPQPHAPVASCLTPRIHRLLRCAPRAGAALAPRLGLLRHSASAPPLQTPAALLYARKGSPVCLTPDLLGASTDPQAPLQMNAVDFLEKPSAGVVSGVAGKKGGARAWAALEGTRMVALAPRDAAAPVPPAGANDKHLIYATANGNFRVTHKEYIAIAEALRPDVCVAMADEQPPSASESRARGAVYRTLKQLDALLDGGLRESAGAVFGNVQGAAHEVERRRSARETANRAIDGFFLGGFGLGEDPGARNAMLRASLEELPHDKARYLSGLGSPLEVLEAVALGVDLIDSAYAHEMASQGYALDLPTVIPSEQPAAPDGGTQDGGAQEDGNPSSAGGLPGKLNLRSRTYRRDARPMVEGCTCACCSAHTRAYIHHMLQCHELAGEVLLNVHNTHNFSQFLAAVRASIAQGASCVLRYQIVGFKVAHAVRQDHSNSDNISRIAIPLPRRVRPLCRGRAAATGAADRRVARARVAPDRGHRAAAVDPKVPGQGEQLIPNSTATICHRAW